MGQVCSGARRAKPSTSRPTSQPAPPPYSAPKSPSNASSEEEKQGPPNLSSHPALRNRGDSLSDPSPIQEPPPTHLHNYATPDQEIEHTNSNDTFFLSLTPITASSTPQWRWTNTQCRSWLTSVLITYGGRPSPVAHRLADEFRGFGPNLYMKEWKEWNAWLGADGQAIFALLMEEHAKEGAVPKEVRIEHYVREGEGVGSGAGRMLEIMTGSRYPLNGRVEDGKKGSGRRSGSAKGRNRGREETDKFVEKEAVDDVKKQVAKEWGNERLKRLTEEREKLRVEREKPEESGKGSKTSRFYRRSKDAGRA